MTIYFNKIKTSQDSPATVDQIRLAAENNIFSKRYWNNQIFSCVFPEDDPTALTTRLYSAPVRFPAGLDKLLIVMYVDGDSSALNFDMTLTKNASTSTYSIVTGLTPSGLTLVQYEFDCGGTAFSSLTALKNMFSLYSSAYSRDIYYIGLFAQYADSEMLETTSPQLLEAATDTSLISIATGINEQHESKFLAGWLGTLEIPGGALPYTAPDWNLYHLYDSNDLNCEDTKIYTIDTAIDPYGATAGTYENLVAHEDSGKSNILEFYPLDSVSNDVFAISNTGVSGVSYDTNDYSSIFWNYVTNKDIGTTARVKGVSVTALYPRFSETRRQSTSGTAVDYNYYNIANNQYIDDTKINALGSAQFNQVANRAGNITSFVYYDGYPFTLPASSAYTTAFYVPTYTKNHWAVNQYSNIYQYFNFAMIAKDTAAASYNLKFYFNNVESGDNTAVTTVAMTAGATEYISAKGLYLEKNNIANTMELLTLQMCTDAVATKSIEIISWSLSPMFIDLTY